MLDSSEAAAGYQIPRYRAPEDVTWYHVLHGNIPNHQIDFMYGPEVPQALLTPTHFSHMTRLMKYIEPHTHASHAFAIGNLSRDDTQHEPGHGAVGVIFGMRIGGATDHAGRQNPPFAHGILTVDRELNYATLLEASATFYRHVMYAGEAQSTTSDFYRAYVRTMVESPAEIHHVLSRYIEDFSDLPHLRRSPLGWDWEVDEDAVPKRVIIVHADGESFGTIAHAAAKIAALLYRSSIKWTAISTGREADIPGGVSVRFQSERDVSAGDRRAGQLHRLEELPEDEADLAKQLFGARPRGSGEEHRRFVGWREHLASQVAPEDMLAQTGGHKRAPMGSTPDADPRPEPRRDPRPPGYTDAGTEIMKKAPGIELAERGIIPREAAAPPPKKDEPRPGREKSGSYPTAAPAEPKKASPAASAKPADVPAVKEWRDVSTSPKKAGRSSAAGTDDIEITVEPPPSPSGSKKWVLMVIGAVAVAAGAAVALDLPGKVTGSGAGPGPTPAPTSAGVGAAPGPTTPAPAPTPANTASPSDVTPPDTATPPPESPPETPALDPPKPPTAPTGRKSAPTPPKKTGGTAKPSSTGTKKPANDDIFSRPLELK